MLSFVFQSKDPLPPPTVACPRIHILHKYVDILNLLFIYKRTVTTVFERINEVFIIIKRLANVRKSIHTHTQQSIMGMQVLPQKQYKQKKRNTATPKHISTRTISAQHNEYSTIICSMYHCTISTCFKTHKGW